MSQHNQHINPMGRDARHQTADGVAEYGLSGHVAAVQTVHHRHVGAQISAPAHTHGGEYRNVVAHGKSAPDHGQNQSDGRARRPQGRHGNRDGLRAGEPEQRL